MTERAPAAICGENPAERMGCGMRIETCAEVFRCTDCAVPFHRRCAHLHFGDAHLSEYVRGQVERVAVQRTFAVLHEAMKAGGYSASRIVERLRELGLVVALSELHGLGLQDIANATCETSDDV